VALPAVERRLMAFSSAVAFVVGAHLGAVVVAAILPLAGTKDAPILILLGVLLYAAGRGRRGQAAAEFVVGIGVLLIGVQMLRAGFAPLAEEHTWALQLGNIDPSTLQGLVVAALLGATASFVAQGPGPLLLIVVSLTQATNFLDIDQSLAILAGAPLGSGMGTLLVSWPFGTTSRRVALTHLTVSAMAVIVMWVVLPWTSPLVETLLGSDPMAVAYGKKILHPNATTHLAVACVLLQTVGTLASMALVRPLSAAMSRALPRAQRVASVPPLHDMLAKHERALRFMQQALSGKAGANTSAKGELEGARQVVDAHLDRADLSQLPTLRSLLAIDTGLTQLLTVVGRVADRGVTVAPDQDGNLQQLHQGIAAGIHDAQELLAGTGTASLETLRAREIHLNAAEAAQRRGANEGTGTATRAQLERALVVAELAGAYEAVGNQLYRLMVALVDDEDF
ncbi:MAG: Na/Pi cotransporter family protein, partial [Nannocystaceae bacterium]|nr:Na/Pi cotransporter family protein [Nannocystaceae bacterium]